MRLIISCDLSLSEEEVNVMITTECVTYDTWCERSPRYGVSRAGFCSPRSLRLMGRGRCEQAWAHMSNLNIYRSSMSPLWEHRAQYLVIYRIDLVLLLLLLIFCDTLLSYCRVLIRIITAPDIPVRRNTLSTRTQDTLI